MDKLFSVALDLGYIIISNYLVDFLLVIVFGPILGWIPQYQLIKKSGNVGNFSVNVCLILLTLKVEPNNFLPIDRENRH